MKEKTVFQLQIDSFPGSFLGAVISVESDSIVNPNCRITEIPEELEGGESFLSID